MLGVEAGMRGGCAPAVFNAANEAAVCLFLAGSISFGDVPRAVASALAAVVDLPCDSIADLAAAESAARAQVGMLIDCRTRTARTI
jgi:1-deoxy-D-xylulose-5-phosphate reductoisomerase